SDDGVDIHAEELNEADLAFHQEDRWYSYDIGTHQLLPRKRVYVVVNAEKKAFAVQMLSYYKDGEAGHPTFVVKELGEPANSQVREVRIDATDGAKWILFDLDAGQVVDGSAGWDLAFQRQKIAVNGDVGVEVAWIDDVVLEEIESDLAGHPTFVVKELGEPANSQVREVRIDATDGAKWILFDLDAGQVVDGSAGWDLAFQRQKIAVNGDVGVEVAWIDDVVLEEIE